jgi:hypothetical protein
VIHVSALLYISVYDYMLSPLGRTDMGLLTISCFAVFGVLGSFGRRECLTCVPVTLPSLMVAVMGMYSTCVVSTSWVVYEQE